MLVPLLPFLLLLTYFLDMHILIMLRGLCAEFGQCSIFFPCEMPGGFARVHSQARHETQIGIQYSMCRDVAH